MVSDLVSLPAPKPVGEQKVGLHEIPYLYLGHIVNNKLVVLCGPANIVNKVLVLPNTSAVVMCRHNA